MRNGTINNKAPVYVAGYDIASFLSSLKLDGRSKQTREAYKHDLRQLSRYLNSTLDTASRKIWNISFSDLAGWLNSMGELSPASIARKKSTLKTFFQYLLDTGAITKNPAEQLRPTKIPQKVPRVISQENAEKLLSVFQGESRTFNSQRNYAVVSFLIYTGVRCQELTDIKLDDVRNLDSDNPKERFVIIKGKGNKERRVFISEQLQAVLLDYIGNQRYKCRYAQKSPYLFVSQKSEKMSTDAVEAVVNKGLGKIGFDRFDGIDGPISGKKKKGLSAHVLRKYFATTAFKKTKNIEAVSKALGHSDIRVTMRYICIDEDDMIELFSCIGS